MVTVIDKSGDSQGWWKAYNGVRVGFVPKEFVQVLYECMVVSEKRVGFLLGQMGTL